MKKGKFILIIPLGILVLLVLLYLGRNLLIRPILELTVKSVTGLPLKIKELNIGADLSTIEIKNLEIYNPAGYHATRMAYLPEIFLSCDLGGFLKGQSHIREIRLNLQEFEVVKNEQGKLNIEYLKPVREEQAKSQEKPAEAGHPRKPQEFQIDVLVLGLGKVLYKDYSKGSRLEMKEYNLNINERFEGVKDLKSVTNLVVFRALTKTTIASLTNFNLKGLKNQLTESIISLPRGVLDGAIDTLKKTTESLKGIFTGSSKE